MNRMGIVVLGVMLAAASLCSGQASTGAPAQAVPAAVGHGAFPVKVVKTLDSSKLKEGDSVEVETAGGFKLPDGTLVPKGSKLTGHVTAAKARSKGDPDSQLTLTFDQLNVANGKRLSIKGVVQAVFPAPDEQMDPSITGAATTAAGGSAGGVGPSAGGGAGNGPAGVGASGATASVGVVTDTKSGSNTSSDSHSQNAVTPQSVGVHGMDNLQLDNGVLTSKGKNVKLGGGVRMVVHVDIFG
jgi:hypothetical protein